jgi:hypothetical protein
MPIISKGYAPHERADTTRAVAQPEEYAVARFLDKTDHLLAGVIAALVICIGFIVSRQV